MTIMPPEGSQMDVELVNLRIKKGYGCTKIAKPVKDKDGQNVPNEFIWGNANPQNKGGFGDPPEKSPTEGPTYKCWPEQKAASNNITTTN